jgi:hypothetical protein
LADSVAALSAALSATPLPNGLSSKLKGAAAIAAKAALQAKVAPADEAALAKVATANAAPLAEAATAHAAPLVDLTAMRAALISFACIDTLPKLLHSLRESPPTMAHSDVQFFRETVARLRIPELDSNSKDWELFIPACAVAALGASLADADVTHDGLAQWKLSWAKVSSWSVNVVKICRLSAKALTDHLDAVVKDQLKLVEDEKKKVEKEALKQQKDDIKKKSEDLKKQSKQTMPLPLMFAAAEASPNKVAIAEKTESEHRS